MTEKRLDDLLHQKGYFESRARARAAVMEGAVSVDGSYRVKPGTRVSEGQLIEVRETKPTCVSRGGLKLAHALEVFRIDAAGKQWLDVGASTGGFTECLLVRGASRVISLDVGKGQLHWKLRNDPRVTVLEGVNARYLKPEILPFSPEWASVDVSFISLRKVLLPVFSTLSGASEVVALVKPQFEAGRRCVGKGGVVRDSGVHREVLEGLSGWLEERGLHLAKATASPIRGPAGNLEFFIQVSREAPALRVEEIEAVVRSAHTARSI